MGECSLPDLNHSLIITCEHASNRIPSRYAHHFADPDILTTHRAFDPGTSHLARLIAKRFSAPCFEGEISRLLIDCNRSPNHRKLFGPYLNSAERESVFNRYYLPFRQSAQNKITSTINNGQPVLHLSIHSFAPHLNGETRRADIGFLYDPRRHSEKTLCGHWLNELKAINPTLQLRRNYPYRGIADGFVTALRKIFTQEKYLGVELEINQKLVAGINHDWQAMQKTIIASLTTTLAKKGV